MPRFFFHIRDGENFTRDEEGLELANLGEAHREAVQGARDILAEQLRDGEELDGQQVEITDVDGVVLEIVPFDAVMVPKRPKRSSV